ncbi:MAG TPA: methyltransferase domain-containing protein [Solirubrobacteraceae bacterium]|jgi:SAM-dependent methyltransferase|nr:methyltransferase domain-containing protein [Solirubrobacteraceae bacterium]
MVDWDAGCYERTAAELEPVARAVVHAAAPRQDERVLDLACGTGNAALLAAAASGARVLGVDAAPRLLSVARDRARSASLDVKFLQGDLLDLPVDDGGADVVLSVFGLIFAPDPERALKEVARAAAPGARVFISAWIPAGPINDMLAAMGQVMARVTQAPPSPRFAWSDAAAVGGVAREAGLELRGTTPAKLAIRDESPEAYVSGGQEHPVAIGVRKVLEQADVDAEVRGAMLAVLREANEDPAAFLVHSPYVVHELGVG